MQQGVRLRGCSNKSKGNKTITHVTQRVRRMGCEFGPVLLLLLLVWLLLLLLLLLLWLLSGYLL